jgi:hypothetical protein
MNRLQDRRTDKQGHPLERWGPGLPSRLQVLKIGTTAGRSDFSRFRHLFGDLKRTFFNIPIKTDTISFCTIPVNNVNTEQRILKYC